MYQFALLQAGVVHGSFSQGVRRSLTYLFPDSCPTGINCTDRLTLSCRVDGSRMRRKPQQGGKVRVIADDPDLPESEGAIDLYIPAGNWKEEVDLFRFSFRGDRHHEIFQEFIVGGDDAKRKILRDKLLAAPLCIIKKCFDFGIRFHIVDDPPRFSPTNSGSGQNLILDGAYIPEKKVCYLKAAILKDPMPDNYPLLVLSYAFDHSLGGEHFASGRREAGVAWLYHERKKRPMGLQFLSPKGGESSKHYFAESMTAYFSEEGKFYRRDLLQFLDPAMFEYLDTFFKYGLKCTP